ncbi:unnamed protein product [Amoebophrya sp. A25]|nr:unnamed protein product [Amoebophrya sp. A25]|eukprot:GSA25T00008105001.1
MRYYPALQLLLILQEHQQIVTTSCLVCQEFLLTIAMLINKTKMLGRIIILLSVSHRILSKTSMVKIIILLIVIHLPSKMLTMGERNILLLPQELSSVRILAAVRAKTKNAVILSRRLQKYRPRYKKQEYPNNRTHQRAQGGAGDQFHNLQQRSRYSTCQQYVAKIFELLLVPRFTDLKPEEMRLPLRAGECRVQLRQALFAPDLV